MSPTVHREQGFRFYFFSREEARTHIHVSGKRGEAKIWLEPIVAVAVNSGLSERELRVVMGIAEERQHDFKRAWAEHFGG